MDCATSDHRIETAGGHLFARCWTPAHAARLPQRAPVVLLHDSLGCVALWRGFPAALAQATGRCVIAYDRLGFSQSGARRGAMGPAERALLPGLRHVPHREQEDAVVRRIAGFLAALP